MQLLVLPEHFAICRLEHDATIPAWATSGSFYSITRARNELSIVCPEEWVPNGAHCEPGWRCLRVAGTLDLSAVGILAALASPLAQAGVGVFAISTFNTDYLLVKSKDLAKALEVLCQEGHAVQVLAGAAGTRIQCH
jgi:hypothetical protein